MATIGERIARVRKAAGLSQESFAQIGGVGRQTQIHYEKNDRSPDAAYLAGLASAGYDVYYIITGKTLTPSSGVSECRHFSYSPAQIVSEEIATMQLTIEDADLLRSLARRLSSTSD